MSAADDDVLTVPEVAAILRVSRMAIYRLIDDRRLGHLRIGRSVRVPRRALAAYIASVAVHAQRPAVRPR